MTEPVDIVLIEPPSSFILSGFPLGLASLAANIAARTQYRARILDLQTADEATVRQRIEACVSEGTRIFGIRSLTPTFLEVKKIAARIKAAAPDAAVVVGGPHASAEPERTLRRVPEIDIVVIGEGEETVVELLTALRSSQDVWRIRGIAYRNAEKIVRSAIRPLLTPAELGGLPFAYDAFLSYADYGGPDRSAIVVTSRGCPYGCSFCAAARFWGADIYRPRPLDRVVAELKYLVRERGIQRVYFEDALFNGDRARVIELCDRLIAEKAKDPAFAFTWRPPCRVDLLDRELLRKMKEAGCTDIFLGLESFDERQLRAVKAGGIAATHERYLRYVETVEQVFAACKAEGVETIAAMILGLPYETDETFAVNIEMMRRLKPDKLTFSVLCLYAGAPLFHTYAREPGYEWLNELLKRDDIFERDIDGDSASRALNSFSVHGPRAIKPRYLKKEAFLSRGAVEHDIEKLMCDAARYAEGLKGLDVRSLSVAEIQEDRFHAP